jgi:multidrug efflux pump subunit AcrA (membrane-fusion protein)
MNPHREVWLPRILALAPLVAAACLSWFLLTGCGEQKPAAPAAPAVEVANVVVKDVPIEREWVGTTDGLVNGKINAQVQGYLIKQNYKEGSVVKKGQVLFEIDPRPPGPAPLTLARLRNLNYPYIFVRFQPLSSYISPKAAGAYGFDFSRAYYYRAVLEWGS